MKERGILFSGPMVKAIQSGAKTQTRRAVKFGNLKKLVPGMSYLVTGGKSAQCIYGIVGDRLYVRETFCKYDKNHVIDSEYAYRADATPFSEEMRLDFVKAGYPYKWTPSIFMPRVASRILLEIIEVRAERLDEISEEDAKAEGVDKGYLGPIGKYKKYTYRMGFFNIWEDINGVESLDSNPWVWVVTFKKIEA